MPYASVGLLQGSSYNLEKLKLFHQILPGETTSKMMCLAGLVEDYVLQRQKLSHQLFLHSQVPLSFYR
jgi:hypothetical protein